MPQLEKLAFGGGCHWCTEAVFDHLRGVEKVAQGWVSSSPPNEDFSEAVIVYFNPEKVAISALIGVHLHTHAATAAHQLRGRYRSAIYFFADEQVDKCQRALRHWQLSFSGPLLTQVLPFIDFKASLPEHLNYYTNDPQRPFCQRYIQPKLITLENQFADLLKKDKIAPNEHH